LPGKSSNAHSFSLIAVCVIAFISFAMLRRRYNYLSSYGHCGEEMAQVSLEHRTASSDIQHARQLGP
jgi:hypothetical protein